MACSPKQSLADRCRQREDYATIGIHYNLHLSVSILSRPCRGLARLVNPEHTGLVEHATSDEAIVRREERLLLVRHYGHESGLLLPPGGRLRDEQSTPERATRKPHEEARFRHRPTAERLSIWTDTTEQSLFERPLRHVPLLDACAAGRVSPTCGATITKTQRQGRSCRLCPRCQR